MTTIAQAWHIAKKDCAQMRWWFAGYLLLIAAATLGAVELLSEGVDTWTFFLAPTGWLVGGVTAALLVQADGPADSRAFWASQPISTSALLLAKVATAVIVLVLPAAVGQYIALMHYRIEPAHAAALMASSLWLYLGALILFMTLAALTRRFASFVGILVAIPAMLLLFSVVMSGRPFDLPVFLSSASSSGLLATIGGTIVLVRTYRSRSASRAWLSAGVIAAAAGVLAVSRPTTLSARTPIAGSVAPAAEIGFDADAMETLENSAEQYVQFLARKTVAPYRYTFTVDSALGRLADGRIERLRGSYVYGQQPFTFGGADSARAGSVWLSRTGDGLSSEPPRIVSVQVTGSAETLRPSRLALVDVRQPARLHDGEITIDLDGAKAVRSGSMMTLTSVFSDRKFMPYVMGISRYYTLRLVWPGRADTVDLNLNSASNQQRLLVLPGASVRMISMWRDPQSTRKQAPLPAPLAEAKLEVVRWTPVARYPVSIEHTYRQPASPQ